MPVLFSNVGAFGTAIATATLAFTGYAPGAAISGNFSASPGAGAATITGAAPRAYVPGQMAFGPLTILGLNLQGAQSGEAWPVRGLLTATGYAPTVENPDAYIATLGSDDLVSELATVDGTGSLILPSSLNRFPQKGSGAFAGASPVLSYTGNVTWPVPKGSGTFAGVAPSLNRAISVVDAPPTTGSDTVYAASFVTGTVLNSANAIGAPDGTFTTDSTTTWTGRWRMTTPAYVGDPSGNHTVTVKARKNAAGGATPTLGVELYQSNALVTVLTTATSITSSTGENVSLTFDSADLTGFADVDFRLTGARVGGGSNRRAVQVDAITWEALFESASVGFIGYAPDLYYAPSPIIALPGSGGAVFEGFAPDVSVLASPDHASLTVTYTAPLVGRGILPGTGTGAFAGAAPNLNRAISPSAGSLAVTGYDPAPLGVSLTSFPSVGSGTFTGAAPALGVTRNPGRALGTFASNWFSLAETFPVAKGTGTFTGYALTAVSTSDKSYGSGTPTSRRATVSGSGVWVPYTDSDIAAQRATMAGTGVHIWVGTGTLRAVRANISKESAEGYGYLISPVALVWGGGIHRPFLQINEVDIALDAKTVTIDLNAYLESSIKVEQVDAISGY